MEEEAELLGDVLGDALVGGDLVDHDLDDVLLVLVHAVDAEVLEGDAHVEAFLPEALEGVEALLDEQGGVRVGVQVLDLGVEDEFDGTDEVGAGLGGQGAFLNDLVEAVEQVDVAIML